MMFAIFMLMLATFMVSFAFLAFLVFAIAFMLAATFMLFATLMIAFAFVAFTMFAFAFVFLAFSFVFALVFWHVSLHVLHFLCHVDSFGTLLLAEVLPVGKGFNHLVHATHHFRAHARFLTVMVALMMLVALLFLVFAAFFLFFVFLFFAA